MNRGYVICYDRAALPVGMTIKQAYNKDKGIIYYDSSKGEDTIKIVKMNDYNNENEHFKDIILECVVTGIQTKITCVDMDKI